MKKSLRPDPISARPDLDFSKGIRGKYLKRIKGGSNVVIISPDLIETFPDSESVNKALRSLKTIRSLKKVACGSAKPSQRSSKTASTNP